MSVAAEPVDSDTTVEAEGRIGRRMKREATISMQLPPREDYDSRGS